MNRFTTRLILAIALLAGFATIALGADTDPRDFAPVQEGYQYDAETVLPYHPTRLVVKFTEEACGQIRSPVHAATRPPPIRPAWPASTPSGVTSPC